MADKVPFEQVFEEAARLIARRHSSWNLSSKLEWQDVQQELMIHLWKKYPLFDATKAPFENWANTVLTNAITNLLRQNLFKYARPCITAGSSGGACVHNLGGGACAWTNSRKQCDECPLYAKWQRKKEAEFNIKTSLSLENCGQQIDNREHEFVDIDRAKRVIDEKILEQLNPHETRLYRLLYIEHLPMEQVGRKMRYKVQKNSKVAGYQMLLKFTRKVKAMAKEIIDDHELA